MCRSFLQIEISFEFLNFMDAMQNKNSNLEYSIFYCLFFGLLSDQIEWYAIFAIVIIAYALYYTEQKDVYPAMRMMAGIIVLLLFTYPTIQ